MGTCGVAAGADKVYKALKKAIEDKGIFDRVRLSETGCIGMCFREALVEVREEDGGSVLYGDVDPERAIEILEKHALGGEPISEWIVRGEGFQCPDDSLFTHQERIVLRNCGVIDPESLDEYIASGGYIALEKTLKEMSPDDVISEMEKSGLRGRGGGGFPTGFKWKLTKNQKSDKKYIICNADEGDPGAFMDRSTLEGDPHAVLEGMAICAYAVGADEGYIYCRAEYPKAVKRLKKSIKEAEKRGFLGKNILGTGFSLDLHVKEGAGAFVCGEETALIASIEGKRGMPKIRPPYPSESGLWGKPTNNNNVETYANVPWIIRNGAGEYAKHGTEKSKGTKVFALAGKIVRGGLIEVPMGMTIREVIFDVGGGIPGGKRPKAVQIGGPSGGCIPESLWDTPIDYDSITSTGAIMGSGGLVVMDETTCMVDVARFFLEFTQRESCGKCTFCRVGTKRMLEMLEKICNGKGEEGDIEKLEDLSHKIIQTSLCGLGQSAPNPVLTTLKYFRDEYEAHVFDKKCPAGVCKALIHYEIEPEACIGCTLCAKKCPVSAISGERKAVHIIDQEKCTKCGICIDVCPVNAVKVV
jgi:NADH-quinone oxidoreductase subunit F